jgi:DNA-binding transcriptional ArsR family regulator
MKHLGVLADAGLVAREKSGRSVACTLTAAPMQRATSWLERYRGLWENRLDRLDDYLQRLVEEEP